MSDTRAVFYVYEHIRPDTGDVFYVGKGKSGRAKRLHRRGCERLQALHADPVFAAAKVERLRARNSDPEFIAKVKAGLKAYWDRRRVEKSAKLEEISA